MQDWRVIARLGNGKEALVVLGTTHHHVTSSYHEAFLEVIHPDLQATCQSLCLQRWRGKPDRGNWQTVGTLRIPGCR